MTTLAELTVRLHAARCQSAWWSEDCRRPDGGTHAAVWRPAVRAALRSPDPAAAVHSMICDADLDQNHTCPDRERHAALLAEALDIPREDPAWVVTRALTADAAVIRSPTIRPLVAQLIGSTSAVSP